jgi:hypothetical protein
MANILFAAVMSTSLALTAWDGADYVNSKITPPPIEGWATRVTPVTAGDTVLIYWNIIKLTDCPGASSRVWHGENSFYMVEPLRKTSFRVSHIETKYRISTEIPSLAPEGDLLFSIEGYYDCPDERIEYSIGPVELIVEGVRE